ncbi:hypothetical protein [Streptomyces torulosus]|uniref:hypothetical protein n=1 Tax=Streptomyces torulosus TaxID=68276 RepID=UPI0006EBAAD6|nr:hypothetical protein [Streptomyces torulosus]
MEVLAHELGPRPTGLTDAARPGRDGEGILAAELDLDDLARARFDLDTTGHYARPDVFTLLVDESPRANVTGG